MHITNMKYTLLSALTVGSTLIAGCSDELTEGGGANGNDRIELAGEIDQLMTTRVNDGGFCDGDVMGVYVVDYDGDTPGTLQDNGNRGNNVRHTYDEANYKWSSAYNIYWKDKHTHIDVYGYYPYADVDDVDNYAFEVQRDQSTAAEGGAMGGYEASDFLWGKQSDVAPTKNVIRLALSHRMANARVTLVEGTGFAAGEWNSTDKVVLTCNTTRKATINMQDGTVTASGSVEKTATTPSRTNDEWRTIVVPQTVKGGTTLFSITIGGIPYKFSKSEDFTYTAGKMSNFAIRVDKQAEEGTYALTLVSESITPWENDLVSHDATAKEYIVINSTAGHLADSIAAAGKDYSLIKNLKIKGRINAEDFRFMREQMSLLAALNLKDVRVMATNSYNAPDDGIPYGALRDKKTLTNFVFPDTLKSIQGAAFDNSGLTGSLDIPEGVTEINDNAFYGCTQLAGTLSLPSTLKKIGQGAFYNCKFNCSLQLPNGLETIGWGAFQCCENLSGELTLPESLTAIGGAAFQSCSGMSGNIKIPQSVTEIASGTFSNCYFGGNLQLHDGITSIGSSAFSNCSFKGELVLPANLQAIGTETFTGNNFSSISKLPEELTTIGERAFAYNNFLSGIIEFPSEMMSIGRGAFDNCYSIEGIVLPASIENIGEIAFENCYGMGSIVCKADIPPTIKSSTFDGVPKDNFTLEVPETAIQSYKTAAGWREFKRIAAHHELVCRPSATCALNKQRTQTLVINAEGDWEVESKPDWCTVTPSSGSKKTEVTLTINTLAKGSGNRTGEVVFKLKDLEYTHACTVSQYDYQYDEDEWVTLQKATKGNNGGINIILLGDGYNGEDISNGTYLTEIKQQAEYFFALEPYKTYRDYFNVYTAIPLSTESGISTVNTIRYTRFNTTYTSGVGMKADNDQIFSYALGAPTVTKSNLNQTLIIMVPHSTDYAGVTEMWSDGSAISFCPQSTYDYPLDSRGIVQHEAGGHGFGKLGDEYIYHNAFFDACGCTCCSHDISMQQALGWYQNISTTGKMRSVPWSQFIFDSRYSDIVDIYEGAYMHNRGVFRSEQTSCMNNNIPYYNTISRYAIVKRIKEYAGETFSYEDFVKHDSRDVGEDISTRGGNAANATVHSHQQAPRVHRGSPLNMTKVRRHR